MPFGWPAGRKQALVLQRADYVRVAPHAILLRQLSVVCLVARRENDCADADFLQVFDHAVINGVHTACVHASHALGADAARKTAGSLGPRALLIVHALNFREAMDALRGRQFRHGHARLWTDLSAGDACAYFLGLQMCNWWLRPPWQIQFLSAQVSDDGLGRGVPACDGVNHESCSRDAVTRGEDPWAGGRHGAGIHGDGAATHQLHARALWHEVQRGALTDREDHGVARDGVGAVGRLFHAEATMLVKVEGGHPVALNAGHAAALVRNDAFECAPRMQVDTLLQRSLHFPVVRGHFGPVLKAGKVHLTAEPHCSARAVNGHVSAAQHEYLFSQGFAMSAVR